MEALKDALREKFGSRLVPLEGAKDMEGYQVPAGLLLPLCRFLAGESPVRFEQLTDVTAVDEFPGEPRFRLVYHLLSLSSNRRLRLQVLLGGGDPRIDSVTSVWAGADWLEREAWDMFGIRFEGHPDLKRILMPLDYAHFPLRKDFPLRGIDPGRHYREWDRGRKA